jgi:hypothetical protein
MIGLKLPNMVSYILLQIGPRSDASEIKDSRKSHQSLSIFSEKKAKENTQK